VLGKLLTSTHLPSGGGILSQQLRARITDHSGGMQAGGPTALLILRVLIPPRMEGVSILGKGQVTSSRLGALGFCLLLTVTQGGAKAHFSLILGVMESGNSVLNLMLGPPLLCMFSFSREF
jgi:hypothetical protein